MIRSTCKLYKSQNVFIDYPTFLYILHPYTSTCYTYNVVPTSIFYFSIGYQEKIVVQDTRINCPNYKRVKRMNFLLLFNAHNLYDDSRKCKKTVLIIIQKLNTSS